MIPYSMRAHRTSAAMLAAGTAGMVGGGIAHGLGERKIRRNTSVKIMPLKQGVDY
jgi:hypothetical protein